METKSLFRVLEDGGEIWRGKSWDADTALASCYHDEDLPHTMVEVQCWERVRVTRTGPKGPHQWRTVFKGIAATA